MKIYFTFKIEGSKFLKNTGIYLTVVMVSYHSKMVIFTSQQLRYLLECMDDIGSQAFLLMLNLSPLDIHMVPSLPPMQYRAPSRGATPQLLRRLLIEGTGNHRPILGSNRSTLAW